MNRYRGDPSATAKISLLTFLLTIVAAAAPIAAEGATPGDAQPPTFTLDIAATPVADVPLTVAAPATVPFKIIRAGGSVAAITLDLSSFANEEGVTVPVLFRIAGTSGTGVTHLDNIATDQPIIPVDLIVPPLPAGGKFGGRLILAATGADEAATRYVVVWHFVLSSMNDVRPATLVIDQGTLALAGVRRWCLPWGIWCTNGETPTVSVHARDKTGAWPLNGVMARFEPGLVAPGPGLDPKQHITTTFDGQPVEDIFASPPPGSRVVPAHGQATLTLAFKQLPVGEYSFPFRFTAMNSADDDAQRLTVTVKMRDSILKAVGILFLGAAMSFIATRFVLLLGQRAAFLQRLRKMRRDWLAEQPPILPVIALRAALSQAEALSSRYWLTGQSEVEARLDEAENLLSVVDQARQAHDRMQHEINTRVVRRRASLRLDQIVGEIGAGPLSQADVTRLKGRLDELKEWYGDQQQQEKRYWADLKPAIEALCAEVDVTAFEKIPEAKTAADTLLSDLRQTLDTEPAGLQGKNDAENNYGRLKILWEVHHHDEVVQQLTRSDLTKKPIDDVYMVVDNFWWERLKAEASKWELEEQGSDAAKHETYAIVTLTARALGDPALSSSYLVRKKLTWHWKITESSKFGFGVLSRGVTSTQPQIAQYATRPGKMAATVQVNYGGEEWPPAGQQPIALGTPITIRRSGDFRIWRFFEARDMISTLLALIVSVVSGLALYAFAPSFGTLKDYLALFTWAAGVDQGKNFLQSLAAYAPASKTTPVAGSPGA